MAVTPPCSTVSSDRLGSLYQKLSLSFHSHAPCLNESGVVEIQRKFSLFERAFSHMCPLIVNNPPIFLTAMSHGQYRVV